MSEIFRNLNAAKRPAGRPMPPPARSLGDVPRPPRTRRRAPRRAGRTFGGAKARRAFTLVEVIVSSILLATVVVTVAPLLGWVAAERRAAAQRQFAMQEAENLMERITLLDWTELTSDRLAQWDLSSEAAEVLPDRQLTATVEEVPGPPPARRVQIVLTWQNRAGETVSPVRLTSWFFRPEAVQ